MERMKSASGAPLWAEEISVTHTPSWSSAKRNSAERAWLWPSVTSALCFPMPWYTDLLQWTLRLSPVAQGSSFYPSVRVLVFCVLTWVRLNLSQRRAPQNFWSSLLITCERKLPCLPTLTSLKFPPPKMLLILKIMVINCPLFVIDKNRKNAFGFTYVNSWQRLISSIWPATTNNQQMLITCGQVGLGGST